MKWPDFLVQYILNYMYADLPHYSDLLREVDLPLLIMEFSEHLHKSTRAFVGNVFTSWHTQ